MATSIFSRKRDLMYLIYFCISVPMMFIMDCQPLYPPHLIPTFMTKLGDFYVDTYKDQFFLPGNTPPFLKAYIWSEVFYQFPTGVWAIQALLRDSPKLPLVLLPFSCVIFITTGTCMVEYFFWDAPLQDKLDLSTLYGPYLALSAFMGLDMFFRLGSIIDKASGRSSEGLSKKKQ